MSRDYSSSKEEIIEYLLGESYEPVKSKALNADTPLEKELERFKKHFTNLEPNRAEKLETSSIYMDIHKENEEWKLEYQINLDIIYENDNSNIKISNTLALEDVKTIDSARRRYKKWVNAFTEEITGQSLDDFKNIDEFNENSDVFFSINKLILEE